jgi:hypothetical protein
LICRGRKRRHGIVVLITRSKHPGRVVPFTQAFQSVSQKISYQRLFARAAKAGDRRLGAGLSASVFLRLLDKSLWYENVLANQWVRPAFD